MSTHITPPPRAEQTGPEAAEPARRESRFDERGIALQTIIIMVVLLAIAGAVAAVLFARAGEETERLNESSQDVEVYAITNQTLCTTAGGTWKTSVLANRAADTVAWDGLTAAGRDASTASTWCDPR